MALPDNGRAGKVASDPRRDRERERDRVLQELHGRGQVYAILDGARDPRVARLAVGSARSWCLYRGNLPAELAEVAPHLFHLRAGHDYADIYFRLGWRNAWGILLATTADQPLLYRHLRTLLRVRSEKKTLVFRYYDPRILRQYLPTCTPMELERFFGPISSLVVEAEEPNQFHLFQRCKCGHGRQRRQCRSAARWCCGRSSRSRARPTRNRSERSQFRPGSRRDFRTSTLPAYASFEGETRSSK